MDWLAFGLLRNRYARNDDRWFSPVIARSEAESKTAKGHPAIHIEGKRCAMDWLAFGLLRNRFARNDDEWFSPVIARSEATRQSTGRQATRHGLLRYARND